MWSQSHDWVMATLPRGAGVDAAAELHVTAMLRGWSDTTATPPGDNGCATKGRGGRGIHVLN